MMSKEEQAKAIAREFNKRMRHLFKKTEDFEVKYHKTDIDTILHPDYFYMWKELEPYLEHCERVWDREKLWDSALEDIKFPSIGVFAKWGLLKKMYDSIDSYIAHDIKERKKVIYDNFDLLKEHVDTDGYSIEMTSPANISIYKGDRAYGDNYPSEGEEKRMIWKISERIKEALCI